jgi:hypothetical protein
MLTTVGGCASAGPDRQTAAPAFRSTSAARRARTAGEYSAGTSGVSGGDRSEADMGGGPKR